MSDTQSPASDDLAEFWYSAPPETTALDTLEFRHPAFLDDDGNVTAVRFVNDPGNDLVARLEKGAPMNGNHRVKFRGGAFAITLPESSSPGLPTSTLEVANITRILQPYLDKAVSRPDPIEVSYRCFLESDLSAPAFVLHNLTVKDITAGILRITATLGFEDLLNKPFPKKVYTTRDYPSLAN